MVSLPYVEASVEQIQARQLAGEGPLWEPDHWKVWVWHNRSGLRYNRPEIVTLCGSTRFVEDFNHWRQYWTLQGLIVLSIEIVTTQAREEDPQHVNRPNKEMLDALHLEKIKLSDFIFVINRGGYIGDSTRAEITFAASQFVPVEYSEPVV